MPDKTLDTKGLACPLPILKTKKVLSELPKGAKLEVLATDPGSVPDFRPSARRPATSCVEHSEQAGVYRFVSSTSEESPMARCSIACSAAAA